MNKILLIDIGGTNIRYAYANPGDSVIEDSQKTSLKKMLEFDSFFEGLLKNNTIKNVVLSVAGPKIDESITMTNRNFKISAAHLKETYSLDTCYLLNDWEAIGYSFASINQNEIEFIKEGMPFNGNSLFIGPGTGLGAALVIDEQYVIPSEIGHISGFNKQLSENYKLENFDEDLCLEDFISGSAIGDIYSKLIKAKTTPEEVVNLSIKNDKTANQVIEGFTISLGQILSDLALGYLTGKGIYIAGGLMRDLQNIIDKDLFIQSFYSNKKNIHKDMLKRISIGVIKKHHTPLFGNLNFFNLKES